VVPGINMEFDEKKIYHHHVPRFYLQAWAEDNRVCWSGYGKILHSELTVVGGENDFYRLEELSQNDFAMLQELAKRFAHGSRETNLRFLRRITRPHIARNVLMAYDRDHEIEGERVSDWIKALDIEMSNAVENHHMGVENGFQPYLTAMLNDDSTFYEDDRKAADFLYGLMTQQTRTRRMREVMTSMQSLFDDFRSVWTILHQMIAVTASASLYVDRKDFKIVLLDNRTHVPFITGDQPVINLHGDPVNHTPPERIELYYPLSPTKAMLFLERGNSTFTYGQQVTLNEVHAFNKQIATHSFKQLFASTEDVLKIVL
jgi:hypothetical protein